MATANESEFVRMMLEKAKKREQQEASQLSTDADMKTIEQITKELKEKAAVKKR